MGYTDFDIALLNAWDLAHAQAKGDTSRLVEMLRRRGMATYTRSLRSWSLVLRANDKRIDDDNTRGMVRMDGARVRRWCSPVDIPYPGVSLDEAAQRFGVNRTTVSRWASPPPRGRDGGKSRGGRTWYREVCRQIEAVSEMKLAPSTFSVVFRRLMLEQFYNRANLKRSVTRVWTPGPYGLDPGGEVWSGDWAGLRAGLAEKVAADFVQQLHRVDRRLGRGDTGAKAPLARVFQWVCPEVEGGCGRLVYKLYLPMPYWTLSALSGDFSGFESGEDADAEALPASFLCLRCAGLVYESSERSSSPGRMKSGGRRRVNALDRLVKRQSGGVLRGRDVLTDY